MVSSILNSLFRLGTSCLPGSSSIILNYGNPSLEIHSLRQMNRTAAREHDIDFSQSM